MADFQQRPKGTGNNRVPVKQFNRVGRKPKGDSPKMGFGQKRYGSLGNWRGETG